MKRILVAAIMLLLAALPVLAVDEAAPDTVYLNDGSVIKGTIKSLTDDSLRIVTTTGQDLTIAMDKVKRFERGGTEGTQAPVPGESPSAASPSR